MDPYLVWASTRSQPFWSAVKRAYAFYEKTFLRTNYKIARLSNGAGYLSLDDYKREIADGYIERESEALGAFYLAQKEYKAKRAELTLEAYIEEQLKTKRENKSRENF